jgi:hypothetical protein
MIFPSIPLQALFFTVVFGATPQPSCTADDVALWSGPNGPQFTAQIVTYGKHPTVISKLSLFIVGHDNEAVRTGVIQKFQQKLNKNMGASAPSAPCQVCFGKQIICGALKCAMPGMRNNCILFPTGQSCLDCIQSNCSAQFVTCSGLDQGDLPPPAVPTN